MWATHKYIFAREFVYGPSVGHKLTNLHFNILLSIDSLLLSVNVFSY